MSSTKNILLLGATGYVGGSVLTRLLKHPSAASFSITAVIRSPEKAQRLSDEFGVRTIVGAYDEADKITQAASEADIVFDCADADHYALVEALLKGMEKRHSETGDVPLYIHTSGTGVLADDAQGMYAGTAVYYDTDPAQIESLAPTQPHRDVDLLILDYDARGAIKSYIILPSLIYGLASGPLVDAGLMNPHSIAAPILIVVALKRGAAGMVGEGKNVWSHVHIDDTADQYLFDNLLKGEPVGHGREGFYFGENGEIAFCDIGKAIGEAMVELGKAKSAEPTTFTKEEIDANPIINFFGTNSRSRAERSRAMGWKPTKSTKDLLASIKPEVEAILNHPERVKLAIK